MLIKSSDEKSSKENHPKLKFHCTHYDKMEHTFHRCYARMFDNFQRKLANLINKS